MKGRDEYRKNFEFNYGAIVTLGHIKRFPPHISPFWTNKTNKINVTFKCRADIYITAEVSSNVRVTIFLEWFFFCLSFSPQNDFRPYRERLTSSSLVN